ncbi:hypothetical protein HD806DRAFT_495980 [Xylariaceae sp. AK1471]|nr:hypothetical protein HD806DRAFT_495980 [Xylariaceae sp. AK1471]
MSRRTKVPIKPIVTFASLRTTLLHCSISMCFSCSCSEFNAVKSEEAESGAVNASPTQKEAPIEACGILKLAPDMACSDVLQI